MTKLSQILAGLFWVSCVSTTTVCAATIGGVDFYTGRVDTQVNHMVYNGDGGNQEVGKSYTAQTSWLSSGSLYADAKARVDGTTVGGMASVWGSSEHLTPGGPYVDGIEAGSSSTFTQQFRVTDANPTITIRLEGDLWVSGNAATVNEYGHDVSAFAGYVWGAHSNEVNVFPGGSRLSRNESIESSGNGVDVSAFVDETIVLSFASQDPSAPMSIGDEFVLWGYLSTYAHVPEEVLGAEGGRGLLASADLYNSATITSMTGVAAVPIPASIWLLGAAVIGFLGSRKIAH